MLTKKSPRLAYLVGLGAVVIVGIFLRLPSRAFTGSDAPLHAFESAHLQPLFTGIGFDEGMYRHYVDSLIKVGLTGYPSIVDRYIEVQTPLTGSILPPVRFLYIFAAYLWQLLFGTEALAALRNVAAIFSILTLLLSVTFAWRLKGRGYALGVGALMCFAPTQIHMSQHALVDGFFTFWALFCLWMLWENLRAPRGWGWLAAYALGLCLMVLTKENAVFVFVALVAIVVANRWIHLGTVTRELLLCMIAGPLLGVVILIFLAGGVEALIAVYQLSVGKNYQLAYAILTGDGPWHRYLVDLLLVNPLVLLLALGAVFRLNLTKKPEIFFTVFIATSYAIMCNVKYGMNLRYANMWDMPLCFLALTQIVSLADLFKRYRVVALSAFVLLLCAVELHQCLILFVQYPLYELVSEGLLRALHILKSP
jgi:4-amino-4-deoxy-L-arabinose transferase-like glycosyltransferase